MKDKDYLLDLIKNHSGITNYKLDEYTNIYNQQYEYKQPKSPKERANEIFEEIEDDKELSRELQILIRNKKLYKINENITKLENK